MADYRIVCVNTEHPHRHITNAGTGTNPARADKVWTVTQVRSALDRGDTFHTISPSTGARAEVHADDCKIGGCIVKTIRSAADAIEDNNLDNLRQCNK
jgi:hypothetical protein